MGEDKVNWEHEWMVMKDMYTDVLRATEVLSDEEFDSWFGDPLPSHEDIMERLKRK